MSGHECFIYLRELVTRNKSTKQLPSFGTKFSYKISVVGLAGGVHIWRRVL